MLLIIVEDGRFVGKKVVKSVLLFLVDIVIPCFLSYASCSDTMIEQLWIVNSKSDRFYKVRDLLNSAGDKYPSVPCKRMLLNQ